MNFMDFGFAIFLGDSQAHQACTHASSSRCTAEARAGPACGAKTPWFVWLSQIFCLVGLIGSVAPRIDSTCPAAELLNACATGSLGAFAPPDSASGNRSSSASLADARDRSGAGTGFGHWIHVFFFLC